MQTENISCFDEDIEGNEEMKSLYYLQEIEKTKCLFINKDWDLRKWLSLVIKNTQVFN